MTLRVLAIDATEDACSAALLVDGQLRERFEVAPRRHSALILPMMDGLLAEAGLVLGQLDALAFARGPGAFTGLRIAAAVIQGAAFAADLPVVPVSSLQALAHAGQRLHGADSVCCALDARMGEVYLGLYRCDAQAVMRAAAPERVCAPQSVSCAEARYACAMGSGWGVYGEVLAERCAVSGPWHADAWVHAGDVATLAARLYHEGGAVQAERALPVYLRDEVAWPKPA